MPMVGFEPRISAGERPQAARLLRSWVRIPPGTWRFVCCECRVLSGRGLCDELITRPEESYRLWCVVVCDLETSRICAPYIYIYIYDISNLRVNGKIIIKKVKVTLVQALRLCTGCTAHRGSRGIALFFHDQRHWKGLRGQRHAPAALYPLERPGTHCTGGWVGSRAGVDRCGKSRTHRDSIPGQ